MLSAADYTMLRVAICLAHFGHLPIATKSLRMICKREKLASYGFYIQDDASRYSL